MKAVSLNAIATALGIDQRGDGWDWYYVTAAQASAMSDDQALAVWRSGQEIGEAINNRVAVIAGAMTDTVCGLCGEPAGKPCRSREYGGLYMRAMGAFIPDVFLHPGRQ